jgi:hypothetical protein
MAHDVFLSYSSQDKPIADAVCGTLEGKRIRCWIAPRDVLPGLPYGEAIVEAIEASRVMVLVFSSNSNTSPQVMREVERAVSKGIPILPLRIEQVLPSKSLEHFISSLHWLDALTPPLEKHLQSLAETVHLLLVRHEKRCDPREGENGSDLGTVKDIARTRDHSPTQPSSRGQESSRIGSAMKSPTGPVERAEQGSRSTSGVGTLPSVRRRLWPWRFLGAVAGLLVAALVLVGLWLALRPPANGPPFKGDITVLLTSEQDGKFNLPLRDPEALPARDGYQFRVEAHVTPAAYLYILAIDEEGKATPLYPWQPNRWGSRPQQEQPVGSLSLPTDQKKGWTIRGLKGGMNALVMLACQSPLELTDEALRSVLAELPPQRPYPSRSAAIWLENGEEVRDEPDRQRTFDFDPSDLHSPVARLQALIQKLRRHVAYTRAVAFAKEGP